MYHDMGIFCFRTPPFPPLPILPHFGKGVNIYNIIFTIYSHLIWHRKQQINKIINMAITPVWVVSATTGFHAARKPSSITPTPMVGIERY